MMRSRSSSKSLRVSTEDHCDYRMTQEGTALGTGDVLLDGADAPGASAVGVLGERFLSRGGVLTCMAMTDYTVSNDEQ